MLMSSFLVHMLKNTTITAHYSWQQTAVQNLPKRCHQVQRWHKTLPRPSPRIGAVATVHRADFSPRTVKTVLCVSLQTFVAYSALRICTQSQITRKRKARPNSLITPCYSPFAVVSPSTRAIMRNSRTHILLHIILNDIVAVALPSLSSRWHVHHQHRLSRLAGPSCVSNILPSRTFDGNIDQQHWWILRNNKFRTLNFDTNNTLTLDYAVQTITYCKANSFSSKLRMPTGRISRRQLRGSFHVVTRDPCTVTIQSANNSVENLFHDWAAKSV